MSTSLIRPEGQSAGTNPGPESGQTDAFPEPEGTSGEALFLQMDRETHESLRSYLLMVARQELPQAIRGRVAPSDIVQETFLEAKRLMDKDGWTGTSNRQLAGWLREILLNRIRSSRRRHNTQKKGVGREARLDPELALQDIAADNTPPVDAVVRTERWQRLREAVARLPEHYRIVFEARHVHSLSFGRIAAEQKISYDAARMLWARAVERLQRDLTSQS